TFSLSDSTQYIDQNAISASKKGCYFLQSVDSCGNSSTSSPTFCTIDLTALPGISKNYLKWSSFKLWKPDGYNVYAGSVFPLKLISSTTDTTFVHDSLKCMDNQIYYQVEAYITDSLSGCHYSFSDTASTTCSEIELPNVFTPNQDDSHNTFIPIVYQNIVSVDIKIYNRWGQLVSRSSDIDNLWDGTNIRTKKDCKVGTYFYVADVELKTYETANTLTFHGHITLIR
ncbi:MAG: gliding motility-associated C-terminal domain-containing protein, partial [Bacteroidia bacterium]|nr:gliding motility-associated C-terminal domain-containing protein [Bacteroidia bacterium]